MVAAQIGYHNNCTGTRVLMKKTFSSYISLSFFAALLIIGILSACSCSDDTGDEDSVTSVEEGLANPYGLYAPGTFEFIDFEGRDLIISVLGLETLEQFQDYTIGLIDELGVSWVRIDYYYVDSMFVEYPAYVTKLNQRGVEVVGCIRPWDPLVPGQDPEFEAALEELIAANPQVTVWQLDNEPDLAKYEPEAYVDVFIAMQRVVRAECPSCRVALAGAAVPFDGGTRDREFYDVVLSGIATRLEDPRAFDIIDLHVYGRAGFYQLMPQLLEDYRELMERYGFAPDIATWITELATYTGQPSTPAGYPRQTEEQQAAELLKRFAIAAAGGVERMAWNRFYENYQYGADSNGYFDNTGLVYNGLGTEAAEGVAPGTRKMAYFAYQTLIAETSGYVAVDYLAPGQYRYRFADGRGPLYLLWDEDGSPVTPELAGGVELIDYAGNTSYADTVTPGEMPVLVRPA